MTTPKPYHLAATIWLLIALVSAASGSADLAACWLGGAVLWLVTGRLVGRERDGVRR